MTAPFDPLALLADARPIAGLGRRPVSVEVDGFAADFVSWGHHRPEYWRNVWHAHSFVEVCLAYSGRGTFRVGEQQLEVAAGDVFVARPGDVHEIESSRGDPLGVAFWGFALRTVGRPPRATGWWSGLLDPSAPLVSSRTGTLAPLLIGLAEEATRLLSGGEAVVDALATGVVVETGRAFSPPSALEDVAPAELAPAAADTAIMARYLRDNFARPITAREVAAQVPLSVRHAQRVFAEVTGESIIGALRRLRLEEAAALLLETQLPVGEIARRCGYTDQRAFATAFGRHYGSPASVFRATRGTTHLDRTRTPRVDPWPRRP